MHSNRISRTSLIRPDSHKPSKHSTDKHLYAIKENEEATNLDIVDEIMAELVSLVMDRIQQIYIRKQTIKFTVHCAHKAFEKLLCLYCYRHSDHKLFFEPPWLPDEPPEPSPPDSWSQDQIPICRRLSARKPSTVSGLKMFSKYSDPLSGLSTTDPESFPKVEVDEGSSDDSGFSVSKIMDRILDDMSIFSRETVEEQVVEKKTSAFSLIVQGEDWRDFKVKPTSSKISKVAVAPKVKLPAIEVPGCRVATRPAEERRSTNVTTLPPIRTDAKYKCLIDNNPEGSRREK